MAEISYTGAFTAATAITPDLYINATPGPGGILPASFGLAGLEGGASWGPVNRLTIIGSTAQLLLYGNPVNREFDLATAMAVVVQAQQAAGLGANIVANRVSDGTDLAATANVNSIAALTETVTITGTLTIGDTMSIIFTSAGITGSPITVSYITKAGDTPTTEAIALAAAINANAALMAADVTATVALAVITITYPSSLTIVFTHNVTPGTSEIITAAAGSATTIFGMSLTSIYTGSAGNSGTWALSSGSTSTPTVPTWRLTLQQPNMPSEIYDNIGAGLTGTALWAALVGAVNNGSSIYRGPSQIQVASQGTNIATPLAANGLLSGGTDGVAGLTSSMMVGTDSSPRTGVYSFRASGISDLAIADFNDVTQEANLQAFGQSEGIYVHTNGPPGETPAVARTAKQTQGSFGDNYAWLKRYLGDWCYYNDNFNGVQRLLGAATFGIARISTLQPQQSGLNKQATGVIATQRSKTGIPYGNDELAVLTSSGIEVICNPIPRGTIFGLRIGCTASATVETIGDEWPRLTSFIARSLAGPGALGALIGEDITPSFFVRGTNLLDAFFAGLQNPGPGSKSIIQGYQVNFTPANNPQSQTARGVVVAQVLVQYYGIARIFLINMQTGATVVIPANSNTAAAAAALAA